SGRRGCWHIPQSPMVFVACKPMNSIVLVGLLVMAGPGHMAYAKYPEESQDDHQGEKGGWNHGVYPPFPWQGPGGVVPGFQGKGMSPRLERQHPADVPHSTPSHAIPAWPRCGVVPYRSSIRHSDPQQRVASALSKTRRCVASHMSCRYYPADGALWAFNTAVTPIPEMVIHVAGGLVTDRLCWQRRGRLDRSAETRPCAPCGYLQNPCWCFMPALFCNPWSRCQRFYCQQGVDQPPIELWAF